MLPSKLDLNLPVALVVLQVVEAPVAIVLFQEEVMADVVENFKAKNGHKSGRFFDIKTLSKNYLERVSFYLVK